MNKESNPQDCVGMVVQLPKEFSLRIARHLLDLSEQGIKTTKADLLIKCARIGLNEELKNVK